MKQRQGRKPTVESKTIVDGAEGKSFQGKYFKEAGHYKSKKGEKIW
jgi:hypothetical protein